MSNTAHFSQVVKLQKENAEIREKLKVEINFKYKLLEDKAKLRDELKELQEICDLDSDEKEEIEEELEEVKRELEEVKRELQEVKSERDELKRDKAIQKLGELKLCYKN
jgi:chromosome segregation ATPase